MRLFAFLFAGAFLANAALAADPPAIFEDSFAGKLGDGWTWIRENPKAWRSRDGALEIRVEPGVAQTVKNALVRNLPDRSQGKYAIEVTMTNTAPPTGQYEQGGMTLYHNGQPLLKLVKEFIDGKLYIVLGGPTDPDGKGGLVGKILMEKPTARLRLVMTANRYWGEFQPGAEGPMQKIGTGPLPAPAKDQISIQCYQGPPQAEHWMRFDDFRILKLAD